MSGCGRPSRPSVPGGVCSWVETSQTAASSRGFGSGGLWCGARASPGCGRVAGSGGGASRVARCWVLRGQAPAVSLSFPIPVVRGVGVGGVWWVRSSRRVPAVLPVPVRVLVASGVRRGVWRWGFRGVFENWTVDASILYCLWPPTCPFAGVGGGRQCAPVMGGWRWRRSRCGGVGVFGFCCRVLCLTAGSAGAGLVVG